MSLKDLSKEQKQYVALGLLAAAILVILMVLGIRFSMATVSAAKEELDDLSGKISSANQSLSRSKQTSEDYTETVAVLRQYLTNAPPERNYYSWATEVIYSKARFSGLEIDSIDEISIPQRKRSASDDAAAISFESYALRIMAHGGYENTKYFMKLLKQDYPLVRFSGVEISSGQSREEHNVQLFMQWPFNFGEISKSWDAVASKKMKVAEFSDGEEVTALIEPGPVHEPATPVISVDNPDSVREPYPPSTRPEVEEMPAPKAAVEPTAPKTQPGMNAEPQRAITVSEPIVEPKPPLELEAVAAEPEPVTEPAVVSDSDPALAIEQKVLPLNREFETRDSAPVPEEPQVEAMEAAPQIDSQSAPEADPAPESLVGPQVVSAAEAPRNDASTGKSEKNLEELLNKESAEEDASLSLFFDNLVREINEK